MALTTVSSLSEAFVIETPALSSDPAAEQSELKEKSSTDGIVKAQLVVSEVHVDDVMQTIKSDVTQTAAGADDKGGSGTEDSVNNIS